MIRRKHKPRGYHDEAVYQDVLEGVLEIDSEGKIWKVKRWQGSAWGHPSVLVGCPKKRAEIRPSRGGYLQVQLQHRGGRHVAAKTAQAHRIVWRHFFGSIPDGMTINHKNGIKDDNKPGNLELMTLSENVRHSLDVLGNRSKLRHGVSRMLGNTNPAAKLTPDKVRAIRAAVGTQGALAIRFGVSRATISNVIRGVMWGHVT